MLNLKSREKQLAKINVGLDGYLAVIYLSLLDMAVVAGQEASSFNKDIFKRGLHSIATEMLVSLTQYIKPTGIVSIQIAGEVPNEVKKQIDGFIKKYFS